MAVIVILVFMTYSYFNVKGSEIKGASNISDAKNVSILKNYSDPKIRDDLMLDSEQIKQLKELVLDSNFTRTLLSSVSHSNTDEYLITVNFDDFENQLRIDCIGNEYINVVNQFNSRWLRINNADWHKTLEEIISR